MYLSMPFWTDNDEKSTSRKNAVHLYASRSACSSSAAINDLTYESEGNKSVMSKETFNLEQYNEETTAQLQNTTKYNVGTHRMELENQNGCNNSK